MKHLKSIISVLCSVALIMSLPVCSFAQGTDFDAYNNNIDNVQFVKNIRDQGDSNTCVYYALTAAAESYALKNFDCADISFSIDLLKTAIGSENEYDVITRNCIDVPLTDEDSYYFISAVDSFDGYNASIKKAVYENGAALVAFGVPSASSMSDESYYSGSAFYYGGKVDNYHHAVSVVGWDDNYPRDNFAQKPDMDGAWICQNSYGSEYGKGGFFYLSYAQQLDSALSLSLSYYDYDKDTYTEVSPDKMQHLNVSAITSLNVINDNSHSKYAYASADNGESFRCSLIKDYTSGFYVVKLPDDGDSHYYFDENSVVMYNGEIISMGVTDSSLTEYEIGSTGLIHIIVKEKAGYSVTGIKVPKYDLGYLRLTYDDGSERLIFAASTSKKSIDIIKYNGDEELVYSGDKELPELKNGEYYTVITFDDTFVFADEIEYLVNGEESSAYVMDGNQLIVVTKSLIAEISQQGSIFELMINSFFSIFSTLAFLINRSR